jgi:hypothetical protein
MSLKNREMNILRRVGKEIGKGMKDSAIKKYNEMAEMKAAAESQKNNKKLPKWFREDVARRLDRGEYDKIVERVDPKKAREIEKAIDTKVKGYIKSGRLPDPKKAVKNDQFLKERYANAK